MAMKSAEQRQVKHYRGITLLEVADGILRVFNSALERDTFTTQHMPYTYELDGNNAIEKLYMVVDTEGTGFNLTKTGAITYAQAKELIDHYL